ncbi:MAG: hypothetical protein AAGK97_11545 [Bacteroidota bacterium]
MNRELYQKLEQEIHSDASPVGIDAKKTHIMILAQLDAIQQSLQSLHSKIDNLEKGS